jgi:hypothetical protein
MSFDFRRRIGVLVVSWTSWVSGDLVFAQQATPTEERKPATEQDPTTVREIGGRLVASGETVLVKGNLDEPARDSSIATKIDTPLIETPRSITIIDRRTLDDLAAIEA